MKFKAIAATRQLAKRQYTWLKTWPNLIWLDSEEADVKLKILEITGTFQ